ncbi:MAG: hypothetical protein LBK76_05375, partial [Verrucomicrobiales bacterium]|nr:hypothetical protein [Verrucomicrobiales bacterium]
QRLSGSAAQRLSGSAAQRLSGSAAQRLSGSAAQRLSGSALAAKTLRQGTFFDFCKPKQPITAVFLFPGHDWSRSAEVFPLVNDNPLKGEHHYETYTNSKSYR